MSAKYAEIQLWKALHKVIPRSHFGDDPLIKEVYEITENFYKDLPLRKNGEETFIHPLNVANNCLRAGINDPITIAVAFLHDYIEESVDIYAKKQKINAAETLDAYEADVSGKLFEVLKKITPHAQEIIDAVLLLTRHKREWYYSSIANIFQCEDKVTRERAMQVKLADRLHNVLSIDTFSESRKLYECFKTLFILNNVKHYLYQKDKEFPRKVDPLERLFNKCAKATYDDLLIICRDQNLREIMEAKSLVQLAYKKYNYEFSGTLGVTVVDNDEEHLVRLFQGVIRKWDSRINHDFELFDKLKEDEFLYCKNFFAGKNYSAEQLQRIINYKDALTFKEMIAELLYKIDYVTHGFLIPEMDHAKLKKF